MGSGALLGPVLPTIVSSFGGGIAVEYKVAAVVGMPPLFVALFSWPMGWLADKVGPRRVLMVATLLYALFGIAPFFLDDLDRIIWTRRAVGIAEGAVMTCSYALIGAYYFGEARARWFALTTGTAPVMALVIVALGGGLATSGWHSVFLVYSFASLLLGTNRIAFVPKRLAQYYCAFMPLRTLRIPLPIAPLTILLGWHHYHENDPARVWLARLLKEVSKET